jgi:phosphatidate cytidylyltransferase
MNDNLRQRLFSLDEVLKEPITFGVIGVIGVILLVAALLAMLLRRAGKLSAPAYGEIMRHWRSWVLLVDLILMLVLLGAFWVMAGVCVLSLLCYQEFARATGLFREKTISIAVVLGILLVTFAVFDNYARLFFASAALTVGLIVVITIPQDRPHGYIQRTALGVLGFLLFGYSFGYLGYFANNPHYRPILILLLLGVEMNDVFAFCCDKLIGGPRAIPNTSPGKTWAGCIGALVLTTAFVATLGHFVFADTPMDRLDLLLLFGSGLSVLGQFGGLLLSSIKRDVGIKDTGQFIPGDGGLLDRFDSLALVPPAAFHLLSLVLGPLGAGDAVRLFTRGW